MRIGGVLAVAFMLIILASFASFVVAEGNSSTNTTSTSADDISPSYGCLEGKVINKTGLSLQEAVFSVLAIGDKGNLLDIISDYKKSGESCWPKSGCTVKDTAQVVLAYNRVGKSTGDIVSWLKSKEIAATELSWYIEIDLTGRDSGSCTVKYGSTSGTVNIGSDMKVDVSGGISNCLYSSGYWLGVKSSCIDKNYTISCNKDFITTLLYQRSGQDTVYVSSDTHSAASLGQTEETISAKCLKSGSVCDYEGTLWAALAFQTIGEDVSKYMPYLMALAEDNERYFPSSFIYLIAGGSEQYAKIIANQKQGKFWETTGGDRFYDTSLGMLALSGSGFSEFENARSYLISVRSRDGCWNNNIRDTAFILYSGWWKKVGTAEPSESPDCLASGKYCTGSYECINSGGLVSYAFSCSGVNVCCSINPLTQTCDSIGGKVCASDETCSGDSAPSVDGSCCTGTCNVVQDYTCEQGVNMYCRSLCNDGETQLNGETCESGVCCKVNSGGGGGGMNWALILIIAILIVLVIIAILMRDKIRLAWYKYKGKAKTSPVNKPSQPPVGFRPMPPRIMPMRPMPGPMQRVMPLQRRPNATPAPKKEASVKDAEMEETLRKLREMSK
jgi:hypothetical protein